MTRKTSNQRRVWRTVQLTSLMLAASGLLGFALMSAQGITGKRASLVTASGEAPSFTVLLAGLEASYCAWATPTAPARKCTPEEATDPNKVLDGMHTDTIMLARFNKTDVQILNIPRDTQAEGTFRKINSSFKIGGTDLFVSDVETLIGERIDYHALVRLDFVAEVIDALGGLDVVAPADVNFEDRAADLRLKLTAGPHHLNGKDAVAFLRMRKAPGWGDDYGRIDRQKLAIAQLLDKLRSTQGLAALPGILTQFNNGVITNADPSLLDAMVPFLKSYRLQMATLPTLEIQGSSNLAVDRAALDALRAPTTLVNSQTLPEGPVRIVDGTGTQLGQKLSRYMTQQGYKISRVEVQTASSEQSSVVTRNLVNDAEAVSTRLDLPRIQTLRLPVEYGEVVVFLGQDANTKYAALAALPETPSSQ
ncbi:LCP family protein [Deinococcus misasensis]|uniref:LCP family protein n=1 Tax=Deinococcus misasensis TaxID=392413 RepID=UPI000555BC8D|nr:LCP family protein [Deinococcus misasensis]